MRQLQIMTGIRRFSLILLFFAAVALGQPAGGSPPAAKLIEQRIKNLRSLADDVRAVETRKLALEIRGLSNAGDELNLALDLSNYATEGDFGRDTLHEVAVTIADGIRKLGASAPNGAFDELARLVHYEGVDVALDVALDVTSDDPRFRNALAQLDAVDKIRQQAGFTLQDLSGRSWSLKHLQGKVVLVNFWATWCPPCRKEMPDLETLYRRWSSHGLVVLAVSDDEEAKIRSFIAAQKYTYPILLDPEGVVNKRFLIQGIPKTLVYDRTGKLTAQSSDMRTMGQFEEMLKRAGLK